MTRAGRLSLFHNVHNLLFQKLLLKALVDKFCDRCQIDPSSNQGHVLFKLSVSCSKVKGHCLIRVSDDAIDAKRLK